MFYFLYSSSPAEVIDRAVNLCIAPCQDLTIPELYHKVQPIWGEMPASTKYHHTEKGGMLLHIAEMLIIAWIMFPGDSEEVRIWRESLYKCILIHDLDKVGKYVENPDGSFGYNKDLIEQNGIARSLLVLQNLEWSGRVSEEELHMLTFCHGSWSEGDTRKMNRSAYALHIVDMISAQLVGSRK